MAVSLEKVIIFGKFWQARNARFKRSPKGVRCEGPVSNPFVGYWCEQQAKARVVRANGIRLNSDMLDVCAFHMEWAIGRVTGDRSAVWKWTGEY